MSCDYHMIFVYCIPLLHTHNCRSGRDQVVHVWDLEGGSAKKTIPVFEVIKVLLPFRVEESH